MNFGAALEALKAGGRIARAGWNSEGMFVYLNTDSYPADKTCDEILKAAVLDLFVTGDNDAVTRMPNINMCAADGSIVTGWLASQTDMLAEDWEIVA